MNGSANEFRDALLDVTPNLRAYARSLCGAQDVADDLVQDALLKAWEKQDNLREMNRLLPWAMTIMRNIFRADLRRGKFMVEDVDGAYAESLYVDSNQDSNADCYDLAKAIELLSEDQREALIVIFVNELTYEEASEVLNCPVGTVKSRVNRGRAQLIKLLGWQSDREDEDAEVTLHTNLQACIQSQLNQSASQAFLPFAV